MLVISTKIPVSRISPEFLLIQPNIFLRVKTFLKFIENIFEEDINMFHFEYVSF